MLVFIGPYKNPSIYNSFSLLLSKMLFCSESLDMRKTSEALNSIFVKNRKLAFAKN